MTFDQHWVKLQDANPQLRNSIGLTLTVAELQRLLREAHKAGERAGANEKSLFDKIFGRTKETV